MHHVAIGSVKILRKILVSCQNQEVPAVNQDLLRVNQNKFSKPFYFLTTLLSIQHIIILPWHKRNDHVESDVIVKQPSYGWVNPALPRKLEGDGYVCWTWSSSKSRCILRHKGQIPAFPWN